LKAGLELTTNKKTTNDKVGFESSVSMIRADNTM